MSRSLQSTDDLLLVLAWTSFAGAAVFVGLAPGPLRTVLALPLVLLLPGYALLSVLFPERPGGPSTPDDGGGASISPLERFAFSIASSVALVPMVAFVLNYTSYGIRLQPLLVAVVGLTLALTLVGYARRIALPVERRHSIGLFESLGRASDRFLSTTRRNLQETPPLKPTTGTQRLFNVVFVLSLLTLTATAGYAAVTPPANDEPFSEFYLLTKTDDGGYVAEDLPHEFTAGQSRQLYVAIGNHEGQRVPYTVVVQLDGQELDRFSTSVGAGETKRIQHSVTPQQTGDRLRLSFLLYRGNVPENPTPDNAYRETHLWVSVSG